MVSRRKVAALFIQTATVKTTWISLIRPDEASANSTIDNNRKPLHRAVKYIQELDERE